MNSCDESEGGVLRCAEIRGGVWEESRGGVKKEYCIAFDCEIHIHKL